MRYEHNEIISAEIDHCSKRIAQLRRSYYARYGWEAFLFSGEIPKALSSELAGELAAYLRRRFGCGVHRDKARVTCIQESKPHFIFLVECTGSIDILLHLFKDEQSYKEYMLHANTSSSQHTNAEYVLESIEDEDYCLVVTATQVNQTLPLGWASQELESVLLREAIQAIHEGNLLEAVAQFLLAVEENPYQRGAYWGGGSILSEQMRIHGEAEILLQMAVNYFPNDAGLWLRLAATLLRRQSNDAFEALKTAEYLNAQLNTNYLWAIYYFSIKNNRLANQFLVKVKRHHNPALEVSLRWLDTQLKIKKVYQRSALFIFLFSILSAYLVHPIFLMMNIGSLILAIYAENRWNRHFSRTLQGKSFHQLTLLPSSDIHQVTKAFQSSH